MSSLALFFFFLRTCYSLPITDVETTVSTLTTTEDPFANNYLNAGYLNALPPIEKKGILESRRLMHSDNATKEEIMKELEKYIADDGSNAESNKRLIKWFSTLMDFSIWKRALIKTQGPTYQESMIILGRLLQDERHLALSPKEKQIEAFGAIMHLNITKQDQMESIQRERDIEEKKKELRLDELRDEYKIQLRREMLARADKIREEANKWLVKGNQIVNKTASALIDYSLWLKEEINKQSPPVQEGLQIVFKEKAFARLSSTEHEKEMSKMDHLFDHLNFTTLDYLKLMEMQKITAAKRKELIAGIAHEFRTLLAGKTKTTATMAPMTAEPDELIQDGVATTVATMGAITTAYPLKQANDGFRFLDKLPEQHRSYVIQLVTTDQRKSNRAEKFANAKEIQRMENASKENIEEQIAKFIIEHGTKQESDKLLRKFLVTLIDDVLWIREQRSNQSIALRTLSEITVKLGQQEHFLRLTPEEQRNEYYRTVSNLKLSPEDFAEMKKFAVEAMQKMKKTSLLMEVYLAQVEIERSESSDVK